MSADSKIEWTGATWNPVRGCTKVSPGCDHCYAETFAERFRGVPGHAYELGFDPRTAPAALLLPLRWRRPRLVFVNSMSDLFHDTVPDDYIGRVWQVMGAASEHTFQVLTKRHGRMRSWTTRWYAGEIPEPYDERPVAGYPGYTVNTLGVVFGKRNDTREGLAFAVGEDGHRRVAMHREGSPQVGERQLVHRLVLTAFARRPRPGEQACHRNGDPSDNRLSNLHWGTQEDNWRDRIAHGNGRSWSKLTEEQVAEIRERSAKGESAYSLAKDFPVSDTQIRNVVRGDQWSLPEPAPRAVPPARAVLDRVWLGVSVEDQKRADLRVPALLATPAAVRFLSCEPLLSGVDLSAWLVGSQDGNQRGGRAGVRSARCAVCGRTGPSLATPRDHPGVGNRRPRDSVRTKASGCGAIEGERLSTGAGHLRPGARGGTSPPHRVDGGQPADDPERLRGESQERNQGRQPTGQSGTDDAGREYPARPARVGAVREQSWREADARAGCPDPASSGQQAGIACASCGAVWDQHGDGSEDRTPRLVEMGSGGTLDWVICGGESGSGARPMQEEWARSIVRQCQAASVPVFVKQMGRVLGRQLGCADSKGHDTDAWPADLLVREFPAEVVEVSS